MSKPTSIVKLALILWIGINGKKRYSHAAVQTSYFPRKKLDLNFFLKQLGIAHGVIARFDEVISDVPHTMDVFSYLIKREALASLHSQKIPFTLEDIFYLEASEDKNPEIKRPFELFTQYCSVLKRMSPYVQKHTMGSRYILKLHEFLQKETGDQREEIGHFRVKQNWIGPEGCPIEEAYFLPPRFSSVASLMRNWSHYMNTKEKDPLLHLALLVAQLLVIHPFMDGNGRIARTVVPHYLFKHKLTAFPLFFISTAIKEHRIDYLKWLFRITGREAWEEWVRFFLQMIIEQGESTTAEARKVNALFYRIYIQLSTNHPQFADKICAFLFRYPVFTQQMFEEKCNLSRKNAEKILNELDKFRFVYKEKKAPHHKALFMRFEPFLTIVNK